MVCMFASINTAAADHLDLVRDQADIFYNQTIGQLADPVCLDGKGLFNRQIQSDLQGLGIHLFELDSRRQGDAVSGNGYLIASGHRIGQVELDLHLIGAYRFDSVCLNR
jgi:hypothetical protein